MTEAFADTVARVKSQYELCFGCGMHNPIGLRLDGFEPDGDTGIRTMFTPRDHYRGFADVLHGGVVAAALDETMAWTAILRESAMAVTAKLDLRFRAPAPADEPLLLTGNIVERRGKRLVIAAEASAHGTALAEAEGLFLIVGGLPPGDGADHD